VHGYQNAATTAFVLPVDTKLKGWPLIVGRKANDRRVLSPPFSLVSDSTEK
jgi:hypothetical protein